MGSNATILVSSVRTGQRAAEPVAHPEIEVREAWIFMENLGREGMARRKFCPGTMELDVHDLCA